MNKDVQNTPNQGDEEVDLIRLLNYFKNGIKSVFRRIGNFFEWLIQFIILLKKNWLILLALTSLGCLIALYSHFNMDGSKSVNYEMVIQSNPISNLQLYAFSEEVKNQKSLPSKTSSQGIELARSLGLKKMKIEAIEKTEDIINNYFDQIEIASIRAEQTDTLYYQSFDINKHKSKMEPTDFSFQKIKIKVENNISPEEIQNGILDYLNNSSVVKNEQENKLKLLESYEYQLERNIVNIDSILVAKAISSKMAPTSGSDQLLVNTASRMNVEADLLRYSEVFNRKLHSTKKLISHYENGINPVTNLHPTEEFSFLSKPIIRYGILGFLTAIILILLLEFNRYLNRYENRKYK